MRFVSCIIETFPLVFSTQLYNTYISFRLHLSRRLFV